MSRFGPTTLNEFTWSVTFTSHPGGLDSCPAGPACLKVHPAVAEAVAATGDGCGGFAGTYVAANEMAAGRTRFVDQAGWPFQLAFDARAASWALGFTHANAHEVGG